MEIINILLFKQSFGYEFVIRQSYPRAPAWDPCKLVG